MDMGKCEAIGSAMEIVKVCKDWYQFDGFVDHLLNYNQHRM